MAIGVETLRKLAQHLPCELPVRLQHQEHRFRSVHGRSVTKQVAMIPTGLGKKGSVLKPGVFENDESKHAPFLISLPFLMFCRAVMFLDPQQVLKIHFRRFNFSVSSHVGPTGALRIPLCHFSKTQLAHLSELHDQLMKSTNEFEVLKTETPEQSGPKEHHGIPETETPAVNHDGVGPQEIAGEGGGEPGCNSSLASNAGQGLLRPVPGQQPRDPSTSTSSRRTSNRHRELRLPNNEDIEKGNISGSHGRVRGDLSAERTDKHDKAITSTESGKFSGGPGPGDMILRQVGPPVMCDHQMTTKLFICRKQGPNYKRLFWRCPMSRDQQCSTFVWCQIQPYLDHYFQENVTELDNVTEESARAETTPTRRRRCAPSAARYFSWRRQRWGSRRSRSGSNKNNSPATRSIWNGKDRVHWSRAASGQTMAQTGHRGHVTDRR
jgi:hypothetical protein